MLLLRSLLPLALGASSVSAFKDTSPFFIFSSIPIKPLHDPHASVHRTDIVEAYTSAITGSCAWDSYIIVSQPSVHAQDYISPDSAPHMKRWASGEAENIKGSISLPAVLGSIDEEEIVKALENQCAAMSEEYDASTGYVPISDGSRRVIRVSLPPLPARAQERPAKLREHDSFINALLTGSEDEKFLVIYTTTPPASDVHRSVPHSELHLYENDDPFHQGLHMELKRDFERDVAGSQKANASLPIFETYNFFSAGIFMGILAAVPLFLILYVGMSAIAGLEVSYFAFSKEMGPAAQKKQQQQ